MNATTFQEWLLKYYSDKQNQRLGQAFLNAINKQDSPLFYEESDRKCLDYIYENYLN